jgi:demethylmenaquinone methyltransferase/2-methoxy-6-polyprenyl-1,4-benzoquinol methylase
MLLQAQLCRKLFLRTMEEDDSILRQQVAYYRARAAEYDDWFLRKGRYDRGEKHRQQWFSEVDIVREALASAHPGGDVLELACGTGLWTRQLLARSERIVAVDAAPEALEISRRRMGDQRVEYVHADLFSWCPAERFDFVFFAFWMSHVPPSRFDGFWDMVRDTLNEDGKVFFVDSLTPEATAVDHNFVDRSGRSVRKLNDGREFEIVKVFREPSQLEKDLADAGWHGRVHATGQFFYYGTFHRKD